MTMADLAQPHAPETLTGILCFLPWATGSKSASLQPMLVIDQDTALRIIVPDDNPFDNETCRPWHRRFCAITGLVDRARRTITAQRIEAADDPLASSS